MMVTARLPAGAGAAKRRWPEEGLTCRSLPIFWSAMLMLLAVTVAVICCGALEGTLNPAGCWMVRSEVPDSMGSKLAVTRL